MKLKRTLALSLAGATLMGSLAACSAGAAPAEQPAQEPAAQTLSTTTAAPASPKYVFLFIGDGMSYPQIQSTSDYLGALNDEDYWQAQPSLDDNQGAILDGPEYLNFMNFEGVGTAVTYDSNSFAPDSASTATSISTGHKTYSGSINVDETGTVKYETIAEQLRDQKDWEIGVITSVNLNHATPAAFYATRPAVPATTRSAWSSSTLTLTISPAVACWTPPAARATRRTFTPWPRLQATRWLRPMPRPRP